MRLGCVLLLAAGAVSALGESASTAGSLAAAAPAAVALAKAAVAKEPGNAEACHTLGLALTDRGGPRAFDDADPWLLKATQLVPNNSDYLADYAGNCLELAREHHSYSMAARGRDLMEKAIGLDPGNLDGRYGLMQFNAQAPWPLGKAEKAFAQAAEIARRDPARGRQAFHWLGKYFAEKRRDSHARQAYRELLKLDPSNAAARAALDRLK